MFFCDRKSSCYKLLELLTISVISVLLTLLICNFIFSDFIRPNQYIINADHLPIDVSKETETFYLNKLLKNNDIIPVANVFDNLVGYYNFVISLLVAIIGFFLAAFAFRFYQSKEEHDEIIQSRLNKYLEFTSKHVDHDEISLILKNNENIRHYLKNHIEDLVRHIDSSEDDYYTYIMEEYIQYLDQQLPSILEDVLLEKIAHKVLEELKQQDNNQ